MAGDEVESFALLSVDFGMTPRLLHSVLLRTVSSCRCTLGLSPPCGGRSPVGAADVILPWGISTVFRGDPFAALLGGPAG